MKALLIYAHFNPHNTIAPPVFYTLRHFLALGFQIVVASTSPVCKKTAQQLQRMQITLINVDNIGYDFYAWRTVIINPKIAIQNFDRLVLLNNSVYGPFFDLQPFLSNLEQRNADIVGATKSYEIKMHLQSYFFYFKSSAIQSTAFSEYWQNLAPYADRESTIYNHELGLTEYFENSGLTIDAFYTAQDACNPTLIHPHILYQVKLPFFKYTKIRNLRNWRLLLKLQLRLCLLQLPSNKIPTIYRD